MRIFILVFFIFFTITSLIAQAPQRVRTELQLQDQAKITSTSKNDQTIIRSEALVIPLQKITPFLAYSITQSPQENGSEENINLWIRFSEDGEIWKEWQQVQEDMHGGEEEDNWTSELMFATSEDHFYQYQWQVPRSDLAILPEIIIHFYNPGKTKKNKATVEENTIESRSCPCPQPTFEERADWCPSGDCPKDATPAPNEVTHLIVHHSAGVNSASDWAAVVRSIWDFHVNTRGWDDVGYNWLIDPNGVLYEGRGTDKIGAHFCGSNTGTEGICVLGDFTLITPTQDAIDKLVQTLAWKTCGQDLYPIDRIFHPASDKNLLQVSGHRDGCNTSCPGDSFYPLFDFIRESTIEYIDNRCNTGILPAPYALTDSLMEAASVVLNWAYDLPSGNIQLSLERSVDEDYRYEEIALLNSDDFEYQDNDIKPNRIYYYRLRATSSATASSYSNKAIVSTIVSSYDLFLNDQTVQVFPNPAQDRISIQIENEVYGKLLLELLDATGKIVRQKESAKTLNLFQTTLELGNLPKGLYLLKVWQEGENASFPITKQ